MIILTGLLLIFFDIYFKISHDITNDKTAEKAVNVSLWKTVSIMADTANIIISGRPKSSIDIFSIYFSSIIKETVSPVLYSFQYKVLFF